MTETNPFEIISKESTNNGVMIANLKNGDEITIASNGLARHNGTYFKNYGDIIALVSIDTILSAIFLELLK
ncbi:MULTISPECIES: hypothetical protein [Leuconostoc]|uniref:hypothetical protein n=1 Tax=Leuconostoc TaxID=1243 RepID=UPI001B8C1EFF|nr:MULTISPECIES: hypothetical protein [Leuconostoc]MBS0941843.1 hypothetical protein [Leuconostoc mesenteroides]MBS1008192.1 hypothetical protein [Leuconostoc suionicum]